MMNIKMKKDRKPRTTSGNPPLGLEGWQLTTDELYSDEDNTRWETYVRAAKTGNPWDDVKLVSAEPVAGRANFWLGHNQAERRMSQSSDHCFLKQHRPSLLERLESFLNNPKENA
jgi:hypothetical protein